MLTAQQKAKCHRLAERLYQGDKGAVRSFRHLLANCNNAHCKEVVAEVQRCYKAKSGGTLFAGVANTASGVVDFALAPVRWAANTAGKTVHYAGSLLQGIAHKL